MQIRYVWPTIRAGSVRCRAAVDRQVQLVSQFFLFDYNEKCTGHSTTEHDH